MAGNVRIYELAKELGIDSAKCIELCEELNIGTGMTASSSVPPQQADRVKIKAQQYGLVKKPEAKQAAASTAQKPARQQRQQGRRQRARPGEGRRRPPTSERAAATPPAAESQASEAPAAKSKIDESAVGEAAEKAAVDKLVNTLIREDTAQKADTKAAKKSTAKAEAKAAAEAKAPPEPAQSEQAQPDKAAAKKATKKAAAKAKPEKAKPETDDSSAAEKVAGVPESAEPASPKTEEAVAEAAIEEAAIESDPKAAAGDASSADQAPSETIDEAAAVSETAKAAEDSADVAQELAASSEVASSEAASSEVISSAAASSEVISSDEARQTISSRATPTSVSGKVIPPPPGRSRAITVDGEAFSPGVKRGRPPVPASGDQETPARTRRRRPDRRRAANVDAVFTPQQTRLPSSAGQGKGKSGRGNAAPFRPNQQRRRKGGRRRRRSVEELRPLDQQPAAASLVDLPPPAEIVEIERASTAQEVAPKLNRTTSDMIKYFLDHQEMVTATQPLSDDLIELYAEEIGARVRIVDFEEEQEAELRRLLDLPAANGAGEGMGQGTGDGSSDEGEGGGDLSPATPRPPVVTIMGHVDHGKTTLLDAIRNTNVTSGEAGGITQHIGAYHVERNGQSITFIDTPGHEAFTAMRNRGANVTDIVVLVVAADDGLMPQTEEAIDHAKAADVPIIVAINKVDLEAANPDRARQQLSERGLVPEAWGGDTVMEEVSALSGEGLDELLESILLMSEVQELTAPSDRRSQGVVLEAHKDVGRGPVATLLVQEGTLKVGDPVVAGTVWGKVRALMNDKGEPIQTAGPSAPVQVLGFSDVAAAGDEFAVAPSQKLAEKVGREREQRHRISDLGRDIGMRAAGAKLEDIFAGVSAGEKVTLNLVLKSDVHGSLEALVASLKKLERDNLKLSFVRRGVGGITENDVQLAAASNATIIGFNVRPDSKARQMAVIEQVEMRLYEVIYKVTEDVEAALLGMLTPEIEEHVTGEAEVREVFRIRRVGMVAGCYVRSGVVKRGTQVRFLRDGAVIWRGAIRTLRRFQEDVAEVAQGFECGIGLSDFQDLKEGDVIETFEEREVSPG